MKTSKSLKEATIDAVCILIMHEWFIKDTFGILSFPTYELCLKEYKSLMKIAKTNGIAERNRLIVIYDEDKKKYQYLVDLTP